MKVSTEGRHEPVVCLERRLVWVTEAVKVCISPTLQWKEHINKSGDHCFGLPRGFGYFVCTLTELLLKEIVHRE